MRGYNDVSHPADTPLPSAISTGIAYPECGKCMLSLDSFITAFVAALIASCRRDSRCHACEANPATPLYCSLGLASQC